jgi:nicotinate-nucleotide adenylyltransferase
MTGVRRVGILGGTFDPIHRGHLGIAERAMKEVGLAEVVFIPAGQPRLKREEPAASPRQRLEMVRLATAGNAGFRVSDIECHRPGPTYTVQTLQEVSTEYGCDAELYLVLGVDALERFDQWKEPDKVLDLCRLVVVSRPGYSSFDWEEFYARRPAMRSRTWVLTSTTFDLSATELRVRASHGLPLTGLLPEQVERYINTQRLYRS